MSYRDELLSEAARFLDWQSEPVLGRETGHEWSEDGKTWHKAREVVRRDRPLVIGGFPPNASVQVRPVGLGR